MRLQEQPEEQHLGQIGPMMGSTHLEQVCLQEPPEPSFDHPSFRLEEVQEPQEVESKLLCRFDPYLRAESKLRRHFDLSTQQVGSMLDHLELQLADSRLAQSLQMLLASDSRPARLEMEPQAVEE